uniref:Uncharacterized protein n=1 Tax=Anguilla anguilla TaxID=7936 RepID=A0A0E9XGP1_ANGAN
MEMVSLPPGGANVCSTCATYAVFF